jgi:signal transduction histidine kinase
MEQRLLQLQKSSAYTKIDSDLKNDLLHQASLELRNPVKSLVENLEQLRNKNERRLSRKQSDTLNIIQEEVNTLVDISDTMMRIQSEGHSQNLEEIDLNELTRQVVNRLQWISLVSRVTIKLELKKTPILVKVYASQISRVIEGLLSNALKYSPPNSHITVRIEEKENSTILTVKDQGEGVDEKLVGQLFERKADALGENASRFGGIGIGLPMIKEIITAHRGEIWITSGIGKGFSISFSLPQS